MGRSMLVVNKNELQTALELVESKTTFTNYGDLCNAISETSWAKNVRNEKHAVRGLKPQMVYVKIKEFGLTPKTKPGRKGKIAGHTGVKKSRKEKLAGIKGMDKFAKALRLEVQGTKKLPVPEKYQKLAEAALNGNVIAACKLKCGECMGYTGAEKACDGGLGGTPCPLYVINRLVFANRKRLVEGNDGFFNVERDKEPEPEAIKEPTIQKTFDQLLDEL